PRSGRGRHRRRDDGRRHDGCTAESGALIVASACDTAGRIEDRFRHGGLGRRAAEGRPGHYLGLGFRRWLTDDLLAPGNDDGRIPPPFTDSAYLEEVVEERIIDDLTAGRRGLGRDRGAVGDDDTAGVFAP